MDTDASPVVGTKEFREVPAVYLGTYPLFGREKTVCRHRPAYGLCDDVVPVRHLFSHVRLRGRELLVRPGQCDRNGDSGDGFGRCANSG